MTDEPPEHCRRCGAPMNVESGLLVDVVRCSSDDCRSEGFRGPAWKIGARLGRMVRSLREGSDGS